MRSKHSLILVASLALICGSAAAQVEVFYDFESPTYSPGPADGQGGWFVTAADGGAAVIIDTDNGPSAGGSQCLDLNVEDGFTDPNGVSHARITINNAFADVVAAGGPLVTFKYDMKITEDNTFTAYHRIPGSGTAHWWTFWCQRVGVEEPTATDGHWFDSGPSTPYDGGWHTITWTFVYGDTGDGQSGQCLSVQMDDQYVIKHSNYHPWQDTPYIVDAVEFNLNDAYWPEYTFDDHCVIDNVVIRGEPLPSAPPVADAGPDVTQDPGSWDGVVLQGGGSSDDVGIVRYRWTFGYGWDAAVLYDGTEAEPLVDLGPGTHNLVLTVFDEDTLRDTDTVTYTIGDRPPIDDEVAGPWGIRNADISGTGASDEVVVDTSVGEFEVLSEAYVSGPWAGLPGGGKGNMAFDRFGNLYFVAWNRFLESYSKDLVRRWRGHDDGSEVQFGNYAIDSGCVIAGVRYIYVVGGGRDDFGGEPAVYAFEKSTGQLIWETGLVGEDWAGHNGRPKFTLYEDKIYVVGENNLETVKIHQIDATTGTHDWASDCYVEMQYGELNNAGSVAFVPDAYGPGLHGLFFNQISTPGTGMDGFADMVAIEIDPSSGATVVWGPAEGIDGPFMDFSHPMYSETSGLIYTPSGKDSTWPHSMYAWQPDASPSPLVATHTPDDDVGHHYRDNFALDFDGLTVHAPGEWDSIRSYTDQGDGTFEMVYHDFGGYWENSWGFEGQGALVKDQNGDSIYFTCTAETGDPNEVLRIPSKIVAINLSTLDPNEPDGEFLATYVNQEWDETLGDEGEYDYHRPYYGPTPGPDGSLYYFQQRGWDFQRIVRIGLVPGEEPCPGDVDGDGDTDLSDLAALLASYNKCTGDAGYNPAADFDDSGCVDLSDLAALLADYGCTG